jgi:hypothetical protein
MVFIDLLGVGISMMLLLYIFTQRVHYSY